MGSYVERIESVISGGRYILGQRGLGILLADIGQAAMPCHVVRLAPQCHFGVILHQPVR